MATFGEGMRHPVLPGEDLLHAAVEEEGDVGILLRLGDAQLGQPSLLIYSPKMFSSFCRG